MANEIRLKRRVSGNAGAPATLKSGELAWNMSEGVVYGGAGDDGGGGATSVVALAGQGAFVGLGGTQTITGTKTFSLVPKASQDASSGTDLVRKSQLDTLLGGKADTGHGHAIGDITSLQATLDIKAPLASPALTGTPTAPTQTSGDNSTKIATTAYVDSAVTAGTVSAIGDVGDVTITTPAENHLLVYDNGLGEWVNRTAGAAGIASATHEHAASDITSGQIPVTRGGTGADTAAGARTALGLAIGSDVQAHSAVLDSTTAAFTTAQATKLGYISVSQAIDLDQIDSRVNALDSAVVLKGTWDANAGTFPGAGAAQAGETWIVTTAGTVDGVDFAVNDRIMAITDNASGSTFASNWLKLDYTDAVLSVAGKTGAVTLAAADILSGEFADARISASSVTQHQGALTLTLSQVSDAGSLAGQDASAVNITGGTIDGVTLDGGTF
jgi:hypothetical protein